MDGSHKILLKYLVEYRRLREPMSGRRLINQLILAYAKQLASSMPEKLWQDNIITLINDCEVEHEAYRKQQLKRIKELEKRAKKAQSTR